MGFLDNAGLQYFWSKLKQKFFPLEGGTINGDVSVNGTLSADDVSINGAKAFTSRPNFSGNMNSTEILPGIYFAIYPNVLEVQQHRATVGLSFIPTVESRILCFTVRTLHIPEVTLTTNGIPGRVLEAQIVW